jgi:hypothetical protein
MILKGTWVSLSKTLLTPDQRTGHLPPETAAVPFVMWVKGFLLHDAEPGQQADVVTRTGRTEHGFLECAFPNFPIDYGDFVPELLEIGDSARALLKGGAPVD